MTLQAAQLASVLGFQNPNVVSGTSKDGLPIRAEYYCPSGAENGLRQVSVFAPQIPYADGSVRRAREGDWSIRAQCQRIDKAIMAL